MKNLLHKISLGVLMPLCLSACAHVEKAPVITILDMRYTLDADLGDPLQVRQVWDDMHAVSALQGIVNRDAPRLFIRYVMNGDVSVDDYWWNKSRAEGEWLFKRDTLVSGMLEETLAYYKEMLAGVVLYDPSVASTSNVASSIAGIKNLIPVRYDVSPGSLYSRVVSGGLCLPVIESLVNADGSSKFTGKGLIPDTDLPSSGSAKNDAYRWFIEKYMKEGSCNTRYAAYYIDQKWMDNPRAANKNHHTLSNHDFFIGKRAFFFDLSPWGDEPATDDQGQPAGCDLETLRQMLATANLLNEGDHMCYIGGFPAWAYKYTDYVGGKHEPVSTEWEFTRLIGSYNAFKDADAIGYGALANASFWTHFPLREKYDQKWVSKKELIERGYLKDDGTVDFKGKNFIIFYVGDYDASSWVYQTAPKIWDDPQRGKVPMMWAISPVLEQRVPMALHYHRMSATKNDFFVAADNGAGYLNPGSLQEPRTESGLPCGLDLWARHCEPYYDRWDLTVSGFIIDGYAQGLNHKGLECYRRFSPNGLVAQKVPPTMLHNGMPVLRANYDIVSDSTAEAAALVIERVRVSRHETPFHWFRNILKRPSWYAGVVAELHKQDPSIELLDAPTFFSLYKIYLETSQ